MVSCSESEWQRFRLISGQSIVNFFLGSVGYFPEASFVGSHLLKSKVCHGNANPRGTDVEARRKLGGYLRGCHILGFRLGARYSKIRSIISLAGSRVIYALLRSFSSFICLSLSLYGLASMACSSA